MEWPHGAPEQRKRESPYERLDSALSSYSRSLNELFRTHLESGSNVDILDEQCRIDMRAFMKKRGGPYEKEGDHGVLEDEKSVKNHELAFSGASDEVFSERVYGTTDREEVLRMWREKEGRHDGSVAEAAVLCLLNKFLSSRFVAVRASKYDDYEHGVDTLILDREDGGVVCAFDEVVGTDGNARYQNKTSRAKEKLGKRGGMSVKYGLSFDRDASQTSFLRRKALPKVPGFCVSLTRENLHRLIGEADFSNPYRVSDAERGVFASLVSDLERQEAGMKEGMTSEQQKHVDSLLSFSRELLVQQRS